MLDPAVELRCRPEAEVGPRRGEPVTCGLPWPRGVVPDPGLLALVDGDGRPVALQTRVLDQWPDGSARWTLLDWLASAAGDAVYRVGPAPGAPPPPGAPLAVSTTGSGLEVTTGPALFRVETAGPFPFAAALVDDRPALDPGASGLTVEDGEGRRYRPRLDDLLVEERGPVRVCLRLSGRLAAEGAHPLADLEARLHFFAGSAIVHAELSLTNPRPAAHPGGRWRLGAGGSVYLRDAALTLTLPPGASAACRLSLRRGDSDQEAPLPLELYQDSSGGENWRSPVHRNRRGEVPLAFRGFRLRGGGRESGGERADPILSLARDGERLTLWPRSFWQAFPQTLEADSGGLALRFLPRQSADLHELQGGERITRAFWLALGPEPITERPLDWARSPLLAAADPSWYAATGAVPRLVPRAADGNRRYLELVDAAIAGDDTFAHKRERVDEYGWRHFGDLYADHEAVFHRGPEPLVSHYNNQYDAVRGFALQFLRSGDRRWFRLMDDLARHVTDIDTYHTDGDKPAYNRGQFWHTVHYTDAGTATHRSYPDAPGVAGGGPSPGHLYAAGLMLHHFLTGSAVSREVAIGYGRYAIDADDGRRTVFRFVDRGHTGHASESGFDCYHGPARTPANAVDALLVAHRLTGEQPYLDKAEQLIRRCIHPHDDLDRRRLADAEHRWYYTMFLQSLGRYLEHKAERGEIDPAYAYARAALLHYARWAAEHEGPYLDRPEILEFPTETWAAQDMRKSEVLHLAALCCTNDERRRLLERARYFFDASVEQLAARETRTLCRPVVILLSNGVSQAWFDARPSATLPEPATTPDFGPAERFVPQKERVRRKLLLLAGAAVILALVALLLA